MAEKFSVQVEKREELGTSASRRLRRSGRVPVVVYGHGGDGSTFSVDAENIEDVVHHPGLIDLETDGKSMTVVMKDYQIDFIRGNVTHIDFQEVKAQEVVSHHVALEPKGTVKATGAELQQMLHDAEIKCPAIALMENVYVDISGMKIGDVICLKDITLPEGAEFIHCDPETAVFQVKEVVAEEDEEATAE